VLVLREALGFSAAETAELLETTVPAVNSALQRARASVDDRLPDASQQQTLKALGDARLRTIVADYVAAWERGDVEAVVAMLTEDAAFAMPPLATWFGGRDEIAIFLAASPLSGQWRWRMVPSHANGQPAIAFYTWDPEEEAYLPFALNVLTLRGEQISDVTAFISRVVPTPDREVIARLPEQPADPARLAAAFENFGLPPRLV
jgi:RNA polymerase sigma-70 factor (ECF subfamily)